MIALQRISRSFQVGDETVYALRDVDLKIARGEYIAVMGPSGSGKSTLLNILGLLDRPTAGHYLLDGTETTALSDARQAQVRHRKIGFVFQFFHLIPRLTAFENVELPLTLAGVEAGERRPQVERVLEELGLADRAHHRPDQLSGGQRQRVAIARATIMQPEVLLADEPTGNLDSASGMDVVGILEALNRRGITLIVVTHDADLGARARRMVRFVDGRIVSDETQPG
ncbi:macrolide ABC transporter ATP-binding protein [Acidihalobacter aeolianus]|uniref:Macrolide ABC transporter ATP-binding protein n=1 Tax=Acidihalobacter aeolianus TaxID=2792603 RepID=A0A1D8KCD3_9GAMM|nr:macrolide ABC transporter ATP-binding protein [Acidihalobacter aeolianus]